MSGGDEMAWYEYLFGIAAMIVCWLYALSAACIVSMYLRDSGQHEKKAREEHARDAPESSPRGS